MSTPILAPPPPAAPAASAPASTASPGMTRVSIYGNRLGLELRRASAPGAPVVTSGVISLPWSAQASPAGFLCRVPCQFDLEPGVRYQIHTGSLLASPPFSVRAGTAPLVINVRASSRAQFESSIVLSAVGGSLLAGGTVALVRYMDQPPYRNAFIGLIAAGGALLPTGLGLILGAKVTLRTTPTGVIFTY